MQQVLLSIPEPCHQDWNEMTPTQQGRHCNSCVKQVIDFTTMTDTEVLNYFSNIKNEKVCGRAYPDQLERAITKPKEVKRKPFWHWNYITILFLFFGKSNSVNAQRNTKIQETIKRLTPPQLDSIQPLNWQSMLTKRPAEKIEQETRIIIGGVRSVKNNKEPLFVIDEIISSNKSLKKINPNDIESITILKDAEATALYGAKASAGVVIITTKKELTKPVYKILDTVAVKSDLQTKGKTLTNACTQISGEMVSTITIRRTFTDIVNTIGTKISGVLKVAPNPVQKGDVINLSFKLKESGAYTIQVIGISGIMLLQKQLFASSKNYTEQLQTNIAWSSGVYYIRLLNTNNKLISTTSFVIQ